MRVGEIRHAERARFGKPLDGVRVLALEQMQALPYATQLLAHLGADVVKVEPPGSGESGRASIPALVDDDGRRVGATYLRNNLGKRGIAVDLKQEEGRALVRRLIPHFDVVAENFKPGVLAKFGLDYEAVAALAPRAIYVSISGFGHTAPTPYASWPAYAPVAEAMAGLYEPNRKEGQPPPVVVAGALGDIASALFAVIGILSALRHRERTGVGQYLDVAMLDATLAVSDMPPFLWSMGAPESWAASGKIGICAGFAARDGWFVMAVFREHQFERLAKLVGRPEWVCDPRFATREGWAAQTDPVVRPAVEAWAADKTRLEACEALCREGIVAGPNHTAADLAADPHVAARDMLIEVPRPDGGNPLRVVGNPVKLSRVAEGPITRFPSLGQHTDAVLRELLQLGDEELGGLRARGDLMAVDLARLVDPAHTALVTQEIQRGVIGDLSQLPELAAAARAALPNVVRLVEAARAAGVPVVHCTAERRADGLGANRNARLFQFMAKAPVKLLPGSEAAQIVPEVKLAPGDLVLPRLHGLSPFSGTELDPILRNLGVTTIVGVGVSVNVAIQNFAFDAVNASYQMVIPRDAVAGFPAEYVEAVFANTLGAVATLCASADLLAAWGG